MPDRRQNPYQKPIKIRNEDLRDDDDDQGIDIVRQVLGWVVGAVMLAVFFWAFGFDTIKIFLGLPRGG